MNKILPTILLFVLLIAGCSSNKPDNIARSDYGEALGELFNMVSWASYGTKAEFKGRIKKGLIFQIIGISEDKFTEADALRIFNNNRFVTELVDYFGADLVYHLLIMDSCALYADLFNGCTTHHDPLDSHDLDDIAKFVSYKKDPTEIKKIVLFVMKETERRTYRPGAIVTITFNVADKRHAVIESVFCPTFPHGADKSLTKAIEELRAPL